MFRKAKGHPEVEGDMVAFLGKGTDFRGALHFEGTIRIDGRLEGDVVTRDTLIVGESAEIMGNISVGTLITSGRINGNINASRKAHLIAPGSFTGDIDTPALQIDEGFSFNGRCVMDSAKAAQEPIREAATA